MERTPPKIQTVGEAKTEAFQRQAALSREMIRRAEEEIDFALVANQINMAGCEVIESLGVHYEA